MIELRSIIQNKDAEKEVKKLYGDAFPLGEKMPYFILKNKAKKENADFTGFMTGINLSDCCIALSIGIYYLSSILQFQPVREVTATAAVS